MLEKSLKIGRLFLSFVKGIGERAISLLNRKERSGKREGIYNRRLRARTVPRMSREMHCKVACEVNEWLSFLYSIYLQTSCHFTDRP